MVISDLVTDTEITPADADEERWCGCIDGALTKEHYLDSIRQAGFHNVEVLSRTALTWTRTAIKGMVRVRRELVVS